MNSGSKIVIVGGGYTGVELAAVLADLNKGKYQVILRLEFPMHV